MCLIKKKWLKKQILFLTAFRFMSSTKEKFLKYVLYIYYQFYF